jgi:hypothetical protein
MRVEFLDGLPSNRRGGTVLATNAHHFLGVNAPPPSSNSDTKKSGKRADRHELLSVGSLVWAVHALRVAYAVMGLREVRRQQRDRWARFCALPTHEALSPAHR